MNAPTQRGAQSPSPCKSVAPEAQPAIIDVAVSNHSQSARGTIGLGPAREREIELVSKVTDGVEALSEHADADVVPLDLGRLAKITPNRERRPALATVPDRAGDQPPVRPPSGTYFAVRRQRLGDAVRVAVEGELDLATAAHLAGELARAAAEEVPLVVADLAEVTLLDSTTLVVLLKASLEVRARGGDLVVRPPDGPARRLLDLVGFDRPLTLLADSDGDASTAGTSEDQRLHFLVSSLLEENAHLQRALTSRIVIEQAKGILAERLHLDVDAAFALLRKAARDRQRRLHELARAVVEGSEEAERLFVPAS